MKNLQFIRYPAAAVLFLTLLWSSGCLPFFWDDELPLPVYTGAGGVLVRSGAFLYLIGGYDENGIPSDTVMKTALTLSPDGTLNPLSWSDELSLPEGRAFSAAYAVGSYLYVIGGENRDGPVDTVFIAKIDVQDGSLGFGYGIPYWIDHTVALPEPRSRMGYAEYDGRLYLIGGTAGDGRCLDTIIQARIWIGKDGRTGHWYTSPERLPTPRSGTAAAVWDKSLYVLGGRSEYRLLDDSVVFSLGTYGKLGPPQFSDPLPEPLEMAGVLGEADGFQIAGGSDAEGRPGSVRYRFTGQGWEPLGEFRCGMSFAPIQAAGHIVFSGDHRTADQSGSVRFDYLQLDPAAPAVYPGSGYVRERTMISAPAEPGSAIHYLENPQTGCLPELHDPILGVPQPYAFGPDASQMVFSAMAAARSQTVHRSYVPRGGAFFLDISGYIAVQSEGETELQTLEISMPLAGGEVMAASSAWYSLAVREPGTYELFWAGKEQDPQYSSRAEIILFEEDFHTEVIDISGDPAASRPILDLHSGERYFWEAHLAAGTYYLFIRDIDGNYSGTIGFRAVRKET